MRFPMVWHKGSESNKFKMRELFRKLNSDIMNHFFCTNRIFLIFKNFLVTLLETKLEAVSVRTSKYLFSVLFIIFKTSSGGKNKTQQNAKN